MICRFSKFLFVAAVILMASIAGLTQQADNTSSIIPRSGDTRDDQPKSFKETLVKMRIDQEKKDYQEMLDRGNEALKLTEELEKVVENGGNLSEREYAKVATVEKLVKKIRGELGGDDDDSDKTDRQNTPSRLSPREAVKTLRNATVSLIDELKKTTRFSISAAAIQSSNAVLRLARFLRFAN